MLNLQYFIVALSKLFGECIRYGNVKFSKRIKFVVVKKPEYLEKTIKSSWKISEEISESLLKRNISQILLTGCGNSFFAGIVGKYMFRTFSNFSTFIEEALELAKYTKCTDKNGGCCFFSIWSNCENSRSCKESEN